MCHPLTRPRVAPLHDRQTKCEEPVGPWRAIHERRNSRRVSFSAEVVLLWEWPAEYPVLQELVDIGDGGFCLHTGHLIPVGRAGRAVSVLPERSSIGRPFVVAWSREMPDGSFHSGCRFTD